METNSSRREEFLQKIKEFCLLDDDFMSRVFDENIECTELILRIILDNPNIKVSEVHTQREIKNLLGHSVRLDIEAIDTNGEPINVEVQRADKGASVKRARYNSSTIDANTLVKGEDYDKLPESYVIFITENDVMGANLPIYHADRIVAETGKPLGNGTHIVYVNGVETMCGIVEELIDSEKKEIALEMMKLNKLSLEEIAKCSRLSLEEVEEIAKNEKILVL